MRAGSLQAADRSATRPGVLPRATGTTTAMQARTTFSRRDREARPPTGSVADSGNARPGGTDITLVALMRLYGMAPRLTADGTWVARHPTARRRDAVVHIDADLSRWWFKHPFVEKIREGDLYSFIAWMEGCGLYGVGHMLRDDYPQLLAEAGISQTDGLGPSICEEGV